MVQGSLDLLPLALHGEESCLSNTLELFSLLNHCFFSFLIINELLSQPLLLIHLLSLEPNLLKIFPQTLESHLLFSDVLLILFIPSNLHHSVICKFLPFNLSQVFNLNHFFDLLLILYLLLFFNFCFLSQCLDLLPLSVLNLSFKHHVSVHLLLELPFLLFYLGLSELSSLLFLYFTDLGLIPVLFFD